MRREPATGQWLDAADGQRWWFDSGSLALDFAYTGGFDGPREWEHWHRPGDLQTWWDERFGVQVAADDDAYLRARELREAIACSAMALASGDPIADGDIAVIDACAATADMAPQLGPPLPATPDRLLATIARDAVRTLARPDRLRTCSSSDCGLIYVDSSRAGNRTWCSMKRCGNRHKVRQLRARRSRPTTKEN
jgi:predicted RNA-binding Zn ribbon-like protein